MSRGVRYSDLHLTEMPVGSMGEWIKRVKAGSKTHGEPLQKSSLCAPTKAVTVGMEIKGRQFGEMLEWENWQNLGANKM